MEKTVKKPIVHLRVYKNDGTGSVSYNADKTIKNENILVKLQHLSLEWNNYLKNLKYLGFVKVEVERVVPEGVKAKENEHKDKSKFKAIIDEVNKAFKGKEKELTPEQKKIAELEAKIDALSKSKPKAATTQK